MCISYIIYHIIYIYILITSKICLSPKTSKNHLNLTGLSKISWSKRYSNLRLTMGKLKRNTPDWWGRLARSFHGTILSEIPSVWTGILPPDFGDEHYKNTWHHKLCPLSHEADIINPSIRKDDAIYAIHIHVYPFISTLMMPFSKYWLPSQLATGSLGQRGGARGIAAKDFALWV